MSYSDLIALFAIGGFVVVFMLILVVAVYVLTSLAYMKALKKVGYPNAWLAWIPCARYFALADVAACGQENVTVIGTISLPAMVYKLWWIGLIVLNFIPTVGTLLALALQVICLGHSFIKIYSMIDRTPEQQQQAIGYISAFIPLIAVVKFLTTK